MLSEAIKEASSFHVAIYTHLIHKEEKRKEKDSAKLAEKEGGGGREKKKRKGKGGGKGKERKGERERDHTLAFTLSRSHGIFDVGGGYERI